MVMLSHSPIDAINEAELTASTTGAKYPIGSTIEFWNNSTSMVDKYVYAQSHAALTQYVPYILNYTGTSAGVFAVITAAPVTNTAEMVTVAVPQAAVTSSYFTWLKTKGQTTLVASSGLAVGTYGKVINAGAAVYQSSSGATPTTSAFCVNVGATSTGASVTAVLLGALVSVTS